MKPKPITGSRIAEILLVEDYEDDVFLTREAFNAAGHKVNLHHVDNGKKCLEFLRKQGIYGHAPKGRYQLAGHAHADDGRPPDVEKNSQG